ncbi:MAG: DUF1273 domain-containing protein [Oscillospiraceae bacterium]|nr:DUF1273 domain-containing protein [Oscillospiraceae bacterium]
MYCAIIGKSIFEMASGLDEKSPKCIELKLEIAKTLSELSAMGVSDFICNAEWGFSLFGAEILLGMCQTALVKAKLHIIAPFEEQSVMWTNEARERYFNVHVAADSVKFVTRRKRTDSYRVCDKAIIDKCAILLTDDEGCFAAQYAQVNDKEQIVLGKSNSNCIL